MICRLFLLLAVLSISTAQAQKKKKDKKKNESNRELRLDKHYPVYVTGKRGQIPSPCPVDPLILSLRDSLKKEGYKVMDSVQLNAANQIVINQIMKYSQEGLSKEGTTANINSRILYQVLRVQNLSCHQDEQQYSIFIFSYPKGGMPEGVNQTFHLPKDSPARIIDVVLGLIRRE